MRPLKDAHEWPQIAVYDIEATEWTNVILVCHIDELGNRVQFHSISDYLDFLFSPRFKGSHVWAHFGGRYDHRFLIPILYERGVTCEWEFRVALTGGSIVILTATDNKGRKIQFADSFRLMPNALAAIGKTINLEKLDVDRGNLDRERFETDPIYRQQVIDYCYRDCEIVLKGLQYMRDVLTSVNADFAFTLASIATRWVRRSPVIDFNRFYRPKKDGSGIEYDRAMQYANEWCLGKDNKNPDRWCAYHGGHTEMFYDSTREGVIKTPVYYYDVVSSYPWSMTNELPLYYDGFYPPPTNQTKSEIERFLSYYGVTEAWVNVPPCVTGPLPVQEENGPLIFPMGRFHGRFTNIELMAALRRGAEIKLGWQCRFESKPFLAPFVHTFYELRKKAKADKDEFRTYAFKILLNSLYGKLVETVDRVSYTTSKWEYEQAKEDKNAKLESTKIAGLYSIIRQEEGPFYHVAAGSYVTAYSRLKLLEGIEYVYKNGGRVYYCDTDSIMSSIPIPAMEGSALGQWNHEYTFDRLEILLPKVYRARIAWSAKSQDIGTTLYRCKGLPIIREHEPPDMPQRRWDAFKSYVTSIDERERARLAKLLISGQGLEKLTKEATTGNQAAGMALLLARDGITGFVADVNAGAIMPRRQPLLRALQSSDKKRDWSTLPSRPLTLDEDPALDRRKPGSLRLADL